MGRRSFPAEANVQLRDDGTCRVACGTQDIGTGTYTILAQLAAEKTGVPLDKVEVVLGDTSLPEGPLSGGSMATGSVVKLFLPRPTRQSVRSSHCDFDAGLPFENRKPDDSNSKTAKFSSKNDNGANGVPFADLLQRANVRW